MLTNADLQAIGKLIDQKLDEKLDQKLDQKLQPFAKFMKETREFINETREFIKFAQPALISLLEESQERHDQKLPERVKKLEELVKSN